MREGLIPTVLGTAVTIASAATKTQMGRNKKKNGTASNITAGLVGFGLAHVVLGTIDLIQHRR